MRASEGTHRRPLHVAIAASGALLAATVIATGSASGQTTETETIVGVNPAAPYTQLTTGPGDDRAVREELAPANPARATARDSLIYFGQLTDFQLGDEESPLRAEFFDVTPLSMFSTTGYRPQEPLLPQAVNASIEQMNALETSPHPDGAGNFATMENVVLTGDLAESTQRNEVGWVRTLLEGGMLDPNSGQAPAGSLCAGLGPDLLDNPRDYTGVGDYDDYVESPLFWDPEEPIGRYSQFPVYPGLFDRAQDPFAVTGLNVPSYVAPGNHDQLVAGNEDANLAYELVALNCLKPMGPFPDFEDLSWVGLPYLQMLARTTPNRVIQVPPDSRRQYVDRRQFKQIMAAGSQPDDHGFAFVNAAQNNASRGSAQYYSWNPNPGMRFIVLDTNSQGSGFLVGPNENLDGYSDTSQGNIDHPQWLWLQGQLNAATAANELVMVFSHHGSSTLTFNLPDELALPCLLNDGHGHDINPGCDSDPRLSFPLHLGNALINLLNSHPNVIAHLSGHTHQNTITPRPGPGGSGYWEISTAAIADWPSQSRVLEVMDNNDGTLSIFGTLLNTAAPIANPPSGTDASAFSADTLASIARTVTYNDPQGGPGGADGTDTDRNVELLINDPR